MHKARSITTWFYEFGVEELEQSEQSPDLKPIEHLWNAICMPGFLDLTNAHLADHTFPQTHSKILWNAFPEDWKLLKPQRRSKLHINTNALEMGCPNKLT